MGKHPQNHNKQPQKTSSNSSFKQGFRSVIFNKITFVLTFAGAVLWWMSDLYHNQVFDSYVDLETQYHEEQKKKLVNDHYKTLITLIRHWNEYDGVVKQNEQGNAVDTNGTQIIRQHIHNMVNLFDEIGLVGADPRFRIWFRHHKALMYLYDGDLNQDIGSLAISMREIEKTRHLLDTHSQDDDVKQFVEERGGEAFFTFLTRDELNIHALYSRASGDMQALKKAKDILNEKLGGCDYFRKETVHHIGIIDQMGCAVN